MADEERRNTRRQRVLKDGHIVPLDNTQSIVNCTIRDVSDTGARLKCGDQLSVPRQFLLRIGHEAIMRPTRVVWRRGNEVGITFTGEPVPVSHTKPKI
jgi:two-component system cell cycle response regulator